MQQIYLVDQSRKHKGLAAAHVSTLNAFMVYFRAAWSIDATIQLSKAVVKGAWNMLYIDTADEANALGYHEFYHGQPLAKIFVDTTLNDGESVTVTATHELAEMLADPSASITVKGPRSVLYAYENCDAVEETTFKIDNAPVTNFVTRQWFETLKHPKGTKFDYLGLCKAPFQILSGGYMSIFRNGVWTQIFGSTEKASRFGKEDRNGHRNESLRV